MRLVPREEKFFEFFLKQASLIQEAARLLHKSAREGNASLQLAANDIVLLERKGDEVIHEIYTKLNQTFITPLDPEDLHALGARTGRCARRRLRIARTGSSPTRSIRSLRW